MSTKTWLITGATSIIAQEFAHLAAKSGCNLLLLARNSEELKILASDFRLRYQIECTVVVIDFSQDISTTLAELITKNDDLSLFIAHSLTLNNEDLTPDKINALIQTNIVSVVQLIQGYFAKKQASHELIFLSSVAGSRGRAKNSLYGASKKAIEVYLEGLQQQAKPNEYITIARLGFIDTVQTYGLPGVFYASPPKSCAKACWQACAQRKRVIYHPFFWQYIMGIIKRLPFVIYKRLKV